MALVRSRSTDMVHQRSAPSSNTRKLQEALYTHLDDLEKSAFIEALNSYGTHRDIFELVNALRKILNTPVKRKLFPLVRKVIRQGDVHAFDLLTSGDRAHNTLPRPFLYRPHSADLNVLQKHWANTVSTSGRRSRGQLPGQTDDEAGTIGETRSVSRRQPPVKLHRSGASGGSGEEKHKTMSRKSTDSVELEGNVFEIDIGEPDSDDSGFGFTIRGGVEHGLGVYVSSVDSGSSAQKKGLADGDLILEANNISFKEITHAEAVKIIKAATRLQLVVSRTGRFPGTHTVLEAYRWTDPRGRPVSPPPGLGLAVGGPDDGRRRSETLMLKGSDERKVNIVVQRGHGLGVMIRGGREYGLGIFISGIDPFSIAENAGLKVGDQILDVNGRSFHNVSHSEAVNHLKSGRHLIITVRDVGKIPFAKTTIDETGWIESTAVNSYAKSVSSRRSITGSVTDQELGTSFSRGAGSQLNLSSLSKGAQRDLIHDQALLLLNSSEHASLNYYLAEYEKGTIDVYGLTYALLQMLNTPAKLTLLSEIRTILRPRDLDKFDHSIKAKDRENLIMEARHSLAPDIVSLASYDSADIDRAEKHKRTMFSQKRLPPELPKRMDIIDFEEVYGRKTVTSNLKSSSRLSRSTPVLNRPSLLDDDLDDPKSQVKLKSRSKPRSKSPNLFGRLRASSSTKDLRALPPSMVQVGRAEVTTSKSRLDDPSDDSGVEINGHIVNGAMSVSGDYKPRYTSNRQTKTQVPNSKNLSSPQRKILKHLQSREANKERGGNTQERLVDSERVWNPRTSRIAGNGHSSRNRGDGEGFWDVEAEPRGSESGTPSSASRDNSYNLVQHIAEVHNTLGSDVMSGEFSEDITSFGLTVKESRVDLPDTGHQHFQEERRVGRQRHLSESEVVSRKSKYRGGKSTSFDFHSSNEDWEGDDGNDNPDDSDAKQQYRLPRQNRPILVIPTDSDSAEDRGNRNRSRISYSKNRQLQSNNAPTSSERGRSRSEERLTYYRNRSSYPGSRSQERSQETASRSRDRSPSAGRRSKAKVTREVSSTDSSPRPANDETSSTSTVVNSVHTGSTVTAKNSTSSHNNRSNNDHLQQHNNSSQNDSVLLGADLVDGRRSRSRSRSPNPAKLSRSRSPNRAQLQRPTAQSLFAPQGSNSRSKSPHPHTDSNRNSENRTTELSNEKPSSLRQRKPLYSSPQRTNSSPERNYKHEESNSSKQKSSSNSRGQYTSNVSVPLIKINSRPTSSSSRNLPSGSRSGPNSSETANSSMASSSSAVPNKDVYAVPQKSSERSKHKRVTISDTLEHIDSADSWSITSENNVTNISVTAPPKPQRKGRSKNLTNQKTGFGVMDGCLGHTAFRLPRPEVYTPVELAIMDDKRKMEAVKEKAHEKYGEIPLDVVYIYRSKPTLGVAIEGGANTRQPLPRVINVQPGGSAFESGGLKVGHVILEVNGRPVVGLAHMEAARLIAEAFKNQNSDRMELLVTEWSDRLLDVIKVDVNLLKVRGE